MSDKNPPVEDGLTVRDFFAAAALTGLIADGMAKEESSDDCAATAFIFADAMMRERDK